MVQGGAKNLSLPEQQLVRFLVVRLGGLLRMTCGGFLRMLFDSC